MNDFEKLLNEHRQDIASQADELKDFTTFEIPRNSKRRPWNSDVDFDLPPVGSRPTPEGPRPSAAHTSVSGVDLPWYITAPGILTFLNRRKFAAVSLLMMFLGGSASLNMLVPSKYYSTSQIYVPAKIESVSAKLISFTDKIDFATMPVDLKIPTPIISHELESPQAKAWVLKRLPVTGIASVGIDIGYSPASEMMVIHGFADSPEHAVVVTDLYKKYFEVKLNEFRAEQLSKIDRWADLRLKTVDESIFELQPRISGLTSAPSETQKLLEVRQKLSQRSADLVLKKIGLQRLLTQTSHPELLAAMANVDSPELQNQLEILRALERQSLELAKNGASNTYEAEITRAKASVAELSTRMQENTRHELAELDAEAQRLQQEIAKYTSQETNQHLASSKTTELFRALDSLTLQKEDLFKLKAQLQMDMSVPPVQYKVLRDPEAEPGTQSPPMVVRIVMTVLFSLVMTALALGLVQWLKPVEVTSNTARASR